MTQEAGGGTVARGMYHLFLGNTTSTLLMAITSIFIARFLGPDRYGLYSIAILPVSYLMVISGLGISTAATRFPAKYIGEGNEKEASSFVLSMTAFQGIIAVLLAILTLPLSSAVASFLNRPALASLIPLVLAGFVGQALYTTVTAGYQGLGRMDRSASLQVILAASKLVISVSLVLAGLAVTGALIGYSSSYVLTGVVGVAAVVAMCRRLRLGRFYADVKVAMHYAFPLYAGSLIGGFLGPIQGTLLAHFTTNVNIGGYGAASNISTLITLFVYPIGTALFPLFSRLADDRAVLAATYKTTVKYATLFVAPVTMLLMALCVPVSQAVYGRAYAFSATYLLLVVSPNLFVGFGWISQGALLNAMGRTRKTLIVGIVSSAASFAASFALVVPFGVYGVILAGMAGSITSLIVAWWMISGELGTNVEVSDVFRIYLASAGAALLVFPVTYLPLHPILVTLLGGVAYLLLFFPLLSVFKAVTREEVTALQGYFGKTGPFLLFLRFAVRYYDLFARD